MKLKLDNVKVSYGIVNVLKGISLNIPEGGFVALLGANGAGKSTTLKAISGLLPISEGYILFNGEDISRVSPENRVRMGIIQVPEGRRVFNEMTVLENLKVGGYSCHNKQKIKQSYERVFALFPVLHSRLKQPAGTLSGGEQQMLAIGRAMMANPKLLMIDEPSLGLAPLLCQQVMEIAAQLNKEGTTILLLEQNATLALAKAQYAYVLELGEVAIEGKSSDLLYDERIRRSYLGE